MAEQIGLGVTRCVYLQHPERKEVSGSGVPAIPDGIQGGSRKLGDTRIGRDARQAVESRRR